MPPARCNKNDKKCDETGKKLGELAARAAGMAVDPLPSKEKPHSSSLWLHPKNIRQTDV